MIDADREKNASTGEIPQPIPVTTPPVELATALIRGTLWSVGLRWSLRLIGLLSTLIVARMLLPSDYGLVAMAVLVMGLIQAFLDADATTALLRAPQASKPFADSAWTLTLLQSLTVASAGAIAAPFAAAYFREPRLAPVIWTFNLALVLSSIASVGPILARKNLNFSLEIKVALIGRLTNFFATVALAFLWRSYWALVIGTVIGQISTVAAGYALHPYRPRISFAHTRELWGFSQWMLVSGIGIFFARKLDGFVVGRVGSAKDFGVYNVAMELGQMITTELGAPLNRALLPVLSTLHESPTRMRSALMKTAAAVNTLTLPAGVGMALVAKSAVPVLLGAAWSEAIPFLALFSIVGAIRFLVGPYYTLFMTLGRSRMLAMMSWFELASFAVAAAILWPHGVIGIAEARLVSTVVVVVAWIVVGSKNGLPARTLARAVARPVIGCALMALALWWTPPIGVSHLADLIARIFLGTIIYVAWISLSWRLSGRPDGLESRVFAKLASILSTHRII